MPFVNSVRGALSTQGVFGGDPRSQSLLGGALYNPAESLSELVSAGLTADGNYFIRYNGIPYQTYCLLNPNSPDGGGWTLAYNMLFNESWIQGQRSSNAYTMNGFWTNTTPGGAVANVGDLTASNRAVGAYTSGISKILFMYHSGANTRDGLAWGYYTRASGTSSQSLRDWFNSGTRNVVWSAGNRTNSLRTSWSSPYANNNRSFPGGGDLFVDTTGAPESDGTNLANYNLVINGDRTGYGYGSDTANDTRFTTTIASSTVYGHTTGGIGFYHTHSGYGGTGLSIGIYDYCDGRRNAIYGNGSEVTGFGSAMFDGCFNGTPSTYNTNVLGLAIFVK